MVQSRLHQVKDAAFGKLVGLRGYTVLHKSTGIQNDPVVGVFRQLWLKREDIAYCRHAFVAHETFVRSVSRSQKISEAPPHLRGMQEQFAY